MAVERTNQCGVCANTRVRVLPLLRSQQVTIGTLYQAFKISENLHALPKYACEQCTIKLEIFQDLIDEFLKARGYFHNDYDKMQHDLTSKSEENVESKSEENNQSKSEENVTSKSEEFVPTHPYDCRCFECQTKFGALPLLVQVIERNSQPQASTSRVSPKDMNCDHCGKTFKHRGDLNKHVRKHTGEQPYTCTICGRKFTHTSNLQRHVKVHSGDKPHECDVCGKKFGRKDKLENHKKTKLCKKNSNRPLESDDA